MQAWWETPNAAFMMRQHFFANLNDRLSTRPFLTGLEKVWVCVGEGGLALPLAAAHRAPVALS
jgi:hypothetical protein